MSAEAQSHPSGISLLSPARQDLPGEERAEVSNLLGDKESVQGAIVIYDAIRAASREEGLALFLGVIQVAIDQALEGKTEEITKLQAEIEEVKQALNQSERDMDREVRASMRERGDYRGNRDY